MATMKVPKKLWEHADPQSTEMYKFLQLTNKNHNLKLQVGPFDIEKLYPTLTKCEQSFWELYQWSITKRSDFWEQLLQTSSLIYSGTYKRVVDESARIDSVPKWFEGLHMNFAENLLYTRAAGKSTSTRSTVGKEDDKIVFTEVREGVSEINDITWGQLRKDVARLASAMKSHGVGKGDRIMVVASNSIVTAEVWLATATLGAIFSSSSTDMGVKGVLQRAVQIGPKVIVKTQENESATDKSSTFSWMTLPCTMVRRLIYGRKCQRSQKA